MTDLKEIKNLKETDLLKERCLPSNSYIRSTIFHREFVSQACSDLGGSRTDAAAAHSVCNVPPHEPSDTQGPHSTTRLKTHSLQGQGMKTEELSFCTEQNSGWCNSYTHLVLGYTSKWKSSKTKATDIKTVAEKLLTEMCQSSLLFFIPNPNLVPQKSQMSQLAKKQLFPTLKLCRQRHTPRLIYILSRALLHSALHSPLLFLLFQSTHTSKHLPNHAGQRETFIPYLVRCCRQEQGQALELSEHKNTRSSPLILLCSQILFSSGLTHR